LHVARCEAAQARRAYEHALALLPGYFFALEHRAELDAAEERIGEAIALYRSLMKQSPAPAYRVALAELYQETRQLKRAARQRRKAIAEMSTSVRRGSKAELRPLALLLLEDERTVAGALRLARRDWENRQDSLAADTLAWALHRSGAAHEALAMAETALKSGTKEPLVLLHAALLRLSAGHPTEARPLLEELRACPLALGPADRARVDAAWARLMEAEVPPVGF
jgi:predicted Zn-dependent protease